MTVGGGRQSVDLVVTLVQRDLLLRYRRSVLGIAWSQLAPLATLAVLAILFTRAIPLHIPHYPLYVLIGLLVWTWFASSLTAATQSVVQARDLARMPGFPLPLLPVIAISTHLVHLLLALPLLVVVTVIVTGQLGLAASLLPVLLFVQFVLVLGPAYLLAAWNVRYRDVGHLVAVALLPLFYATPVFYDADSIPGHYRTIFDLNPMAWLVAGYRDVLIDGDVPPVLPLVLITLVSAALAYAGYVLFRSRAPRLVEEL